MKNFYKYVFLSTIIFFIVDYLVAYKSWEKFTPVFPWIFAFYIAWASIFGYLIYKKFWNLKRIFIFMLIFSILIEMTIGSNPYLKFSNMYLFIITTIILWIEYTIITIVPMLIINRNGTKNL